MDAVAFGVRGVFFPPLSLLVFDMKSSSNNDEQQGFTLIELMIVLTIIAILAVIALPAYQSYVARTQIAEAVSLLSALKGPQAGYCAAEGNISDDLARFGATTSGRYVAYIEATPIDQGAGVLTAMMRDVGVSPDLKGRTLTMSTYDCGKTWDCSGGTVPARYRPGPC